MLILWWLILWRSKEGCLKAGYDVFVVNTDWSINKARDNLDVNRIVVSADKAAAGYTILQNQASAAMGLDR